MSADFWAGYVSGAIGIVVGNPLDILKVRLQAGTRAPTLQPSLGASSTSLSWLRGAAAPVLGYGALNSLLFVTYNRSLAVFDRSITDPTKLLDTPLSKIWAAGALGGLASWIVSAPSELVKCRAQLCVDGESSSWAVCKRVLKKGGIRGLYLGGAVTSIRDSVGYGFYFWSYELSKRTLKLLHENPPEDSGTVDVLLSGGMAGVITWASIYPLDLVKTRLQTMPVHEETRGLLPDAEHRQGPLLITRDIYGNGKLVAFYRGIGVCSLRAFIVNAVQWYTYETVMRTISSV